MPSNEGYYRLMRVQTANPEAPLLPAPLKDPLHPAVNPIGHYLRHILERSHAK